MPFAIDPPDLPELLDERLGDVDPAELRLSGVRIEGGEGEPPIAATAVRINESELSGLVFEPEAVRDLTLRDVAMGGCDLSNVNARAGSMVRTTIARSRLVGLSVADLKIQDLHVEDSTMMLASFAGSKLRTVAFEGVNLREASFMEAALELVAFIDCDLAGVDFRGAKLQRCLIRGSSLEDVSGVGSLKGLTMPWPDIVASAGALAQELGINIEADGSG